MNIVKLNTNDLSLNFSDTFVIISIVALKLHGRI